MVKSSIFRSNQTSQRRGAAAPCRPRAPAPAVEGQPGAGALARAADDVQVTQELDLGVEGVSRWGTGGQVSELIVQGGAPQVM